MKPEKPRLLIITYPFSDKVGQVLLRKFLTMLRPLSSKLTAVTGLFEIEYPEINIISLAGRRNDSILAKTVEQSLYQVRVLPMVYRMRREYDLVIFYIGANLFLPALASKLLRKPFLVIMTDAGARKQVRAKWEVGGISSVLELVGLSLWDMLERMTVLLSDSFVVYTESLLRETNLCGLSHKALIAHEHYVDVDKFKLTKALRDRNQVVGYVGRLSEEKGVMNLLRAMPMILSRLPQTEFVICGEGRLKDKIEDFVTKNELQTKVRILGWVSNDELPALLNELRILVLPSYTEGLPNIMLESMACGTPFLATPVGGIPDILRDGETGFILKDNSPSSIAESVVAITKREDLDRIALNARQLIAEEFTYGKVLDSWKGILDRLSQGGHETTRG